MRLLGSQLGLDCLDEEGNLVTSGEIDSLESDDLRQSSLLRFKESNATSVTSTVLQALKALKALKLMVVRVFVTLVVIAYTPECFLIGMATPANLK